MPSISSSERRRQQRVKNPAVCRVSTASEAESDSTKRTSPGLTLGFKTLYFGAKPTEPTHPQKHWLKYNVIDKAGFL